MRDGFAKQGRQIAAIRKDIDQIVDGFLPNIWAIVLIDKCSTLKQWSIKNRA